MGSNSQRLDFFVPGKAKPGGSINAIPFRKKDGKLGVRKPQDSKNHDWKSAITYAGYEARGEQPLFDGPVRLTVEFIMHRPNHHFVANNRDRDLKQSAPTYHTIAPDTTKLLRALEDALNQVVWTDDCRVAEQTATKTYGDRPGAHIVIEEIEE